MGFLLYEHPVHSPYSSGCVCTYTRVHLRVHVHVVVPTRTHTCMSRHVCPCVSVHTHARVPVVLVGVACACGSVCTRMCAHTHPPPHFPHQVARGWCLPTESPPQSQSRGGAWPAGQVGLLTKHGPLLGTPDVRETPGEGAFHSRPSVPRGSRAPTGPGTQAEQSCMGRGRGSSLTLPSQTPRGMGPFCPHPDPTPVCVCVYACMCWHTCALRTHVFIF